MKTEETRMIESISRLRAATPVGSRRPGRPAKMEDRALVEKEDVWHVCNLLDSAYRGFPPPGAKKIIDTSDSERINWYNKNGSAIYMTAGGRYTPSQWAIRPRDENGHLIYDNYKSRLVPTFREAVDEARRLETGACKFTRDCKPVGPPNRLIKEGVQPTKTRSRFVEEGLGTVRARRSPSWRERYFKVAKANKLAQAQIAECQRQVKLILDTFSALGITP